MKILGYSLLALSCISFILIAVFPWFGFTKGQIAGITTILLIVGEVTFYLSILILGKSFYQKIKAWFGFGKKKNKETEASPPEENKL
jgi:ABC-type Na+ efflux pump permease subunit